MACGKQFSLEHYTDCEWNVNRGLDDDLPAPVAVLVVKQHMRVSEDGNYAASMVPYETMCLHKAITNEDIINVLSNEAAEFDVDFPTGECRFIEPMISNSELFAARIVMSHGSIVVPARISHLRACIK